MFSFNHIRTKSCTINFYHHFSTMTRSFPSSQSRSNAHASQERHLSARHEMPPVLTQKAYQRRTRAGINQPSFHIDRPLSAAQKVTPLDAIDLRIPVEPRLHDHTISRAHVAQSGNRQGLSSNNRQMAGPETNLETSEPTRRLSQVPDTQDASDEIIDAQSQPQTQPITNDGNSSNSVSISVVDEILRKHCARVCGRILKEIRYTNAKIDAIEVQLKELRDTGRCTSEILNVVALSFGTDSQSKKVYVLILWPKFGR